jgi:catechol 2,3-dioxygenase-like lactoylglutathione lyase family enzyme
MSRGLDHIVHAVRDLDSAAKFYRRLGFTVGARNRHPWGTHNHIVQLQGSFIELLAVAEPEKLGRDGFSNLFGRFNQSFLARRQGLSMLILESGDAAADAVAFKSAGIAASEALKFEREGRRPDGATVKVAFSLAFARDEKAPDIGFAVCQQHFPENFWNPAFQQHVNSASNIVSVVLVADDPRQHHVFLSTFTGVRDLAAAAGEVTATTARGDVKVMEPAAFRDRFGLDSPDVSGGACLAALEFRLRDRATLAAVHAAGGITSSTRMTIVAPDAAMGATLMFA